MNPGDYGSTAGSHPKQGAWPRSSPGEYTAPPRYSNVQYMFLPWLCVTFISLWALLFHGFGFVVTIFPAFALVLCSAVFVHSSYRQETQRSEGHRPATPDVWPKVNMLLLILVGSLVAGIVTIITYVYYYQPYDQLGGGATYLNVLPSQPGAAAADATAIMFADGTKVDTKRSYGFTDAKGSGDTYCVAPVANKWTELEPVVQFFAAGTDCCGEKGGSFGCGDGGARGATVIAREENADPGYHSAVESAAAKYGLAPATGYLLLKMVKDPMETRHDMLSNAIKIVVVFIVVYFIISIPVGYMAHKYSQGSTIIK